VIAYLPARRDEFDNAFFGRNLIVDLAVCRLQAPSSFDFWNQLCRRLQGCFGYLHSGNLTGVGKFVCYLEVKPGALFDKGSVKQTLAGRLYACMMSDSYVVLEKVSFNSRHKIDHTTLKSAIDASDSSSKPKAGLSMQDGAVAKVLLRLQADVLGTPPASICPDETFLISAAIRCCRWH